MTTHSCQECPYTTTRLFNLERHIASRHNLEKQKNASKQQKSASLLQKNASLLQKNASCDEHSCENLPPTCEKCHKTFTRKTSLKVHLETCDGTRKGMCKLCKGIYNNRSSLDRHKKVCTGQIIQRPSQTAPIVQNITIQQNITNNYNIVDNSTTLNMLSFPSDDTDFDFITKNITQNMMKKCVTAQRAEVGFNKFMGAVLDHAENQIVRKSNPNVNYSKIHTGDNEWILAPDNDVFPLMTHHMTTAALAKLEEFKRSMSLICDSFQRYVHTVNSDDDCKEYQDTIQRLKLMVVNMTQKIEAAEKKERIQKIQNDEITKD